MYAVEEFYQPCEVMAENMILTIVICIIKKVAMGLTNDLNTNEVSLKLSIVLSEPIVDAC